MTKLQDLPPALLKEIARSGLDVSSMNSLLEALYVLRGREFVSLYEECTDVLCHKAMTMFQKLPPLHYDYYLRTSNMHSSYVQEEHDYIEALHDLVRFACICLEMPLTDGNDHRFCMMVSYLTSQATKFIRIEPLDALRHAWASRNTRSPNYLYKTGSWIKAVMTHAAGIAIEAGHTKYIDVLLSYADLIDKEDECAVERALRCDEQLNADFKMLKENHVEHLVVPSFSNVISVGTKRKMEVRKAVVSTIVQEGLTALMKCEEKDHSRLQMLLMYASAMSHPEVQEHYAHIMSHALLFVHSVHGTVSAVKAQADVVTNTLISKMPLDAQRWTMDRNQGELLRRALHDIIMYHVTYDSDRGVSALSENPDFMTMMQRVWAPNKGDQTGSGISLQTLQEVAAVVVRHRPGCSPEREKMMQLLRVMRQVFPSKLGSYATSALSPEDSRGMMLDKNVIRNKEDILAILKSTPSELGTAAKRAKDKRMKDEAQNTGDTPPPKTSRRGG